MKKLSVVTVALALSVALFSLANAGVMGGFGGGCGSCGPQGTTSDQFRKFQSETLDLRQEMMTRRFELQRENLQAVPDAAKVAALQSDIAVLQGRISEVRVKSGLPVGKSDGECGPGMGRRGMGGCNGPCGAQR